MEEIKVWRIVSGGSAAQKVVAVEPISQTTTERELEDVLTATPDLLMPGLHLVGRQTDTPGGPLDLLGVDEEGRLVVFELKRGNLTRDAVAQALDYVSYLADLEPDELCKHINENSGRSGTEHVDDFSDWYQRQFSRPVSEIGRPRAVLVGLGVDERAKRMVEFLAKSELDISLITFHGFTQNGETLLARQVEVSSTVGPTEITSTKLGNQIKLDKLLDRLSIKPNFEALATAVRSGFGGSAYQWPNATGYTFSLPDVTTLGNPTNRAYVGLFASESKAGKIQILLQPRAIEIVGQNPLKQMASKLGSNFVLKPAGWGEFWIEGHKSSSTNAEALTGLARIVADGWQAKREAQETAEAKELIVEAAEAMSSS